MYSVFLVDDEIVVREGIRNNIPWEKHPYSLVGEAPDGEMALSIMKDIKPDILITDIKMPFMDGLALARVIRKTQPWVKIIILSGHDEFQYAKEAISIGVEEYLLKPFSSAELMEVLSKVALRIEQEQDELTGIENLKRQVLSTADIRRESWLCDLVAGFVPSAEAVERSRELDLDLVARGYLVSVMELSVDGAYNQELLSARVMIKTHLAQRSEVIAFSEGAERQVMIVKQVGGEPLEETAYSLAQGIKYEIMKNTRCRMAVGIGRPVERIGEICLSYEGAAAVLKYMTDTGQQLILGINDVHTHPQGQISMIPPEGDQIAERLKYAVHSEVDDIMQSYRDLLGENPEHSPFICNYLLGDIIVAATRIVEDLGGAVQEVIPSFLQKENLSQIIQSRESFCSHVRELIEQILAYRDSRGKSKHYDMIRKANEYIKTHYADPDISLHSVSEFVHVSPNHFSTVYSQETGQTFIEYLTSVRIERAKYLLLTSDMKNADIGYDAGFNDPHYFSFIFKKNVGLSPREFRSEKNVHSG